MLDPKLQDGQKILKWNDHAWMDQYIEFSGENLSLAANIRICGPVKLFLDFMSSVMIFLDHIKF